MVVVVQFVTQNLSVAMSKEHKKKEERLRRWDLVKDILRAS